MPRGARRSRHRVLIAGGGVAALEATLALHELVGHRVDVTLLAPEREFLYRPVTVAEAFGRGEARTFALADIVAHAHLLHDSLAAVLPGSRTVVTGSGARIGFDSLILATGAVPREPIPGAVTFRGRGDVPALRGVLLELVAGDASSLAVTVPPGCTWSLPAYELALMSAAHLREHGSSASVWLVTPEEAPLELFGPAAAAAIEPLLSARAIRLRTSSRPARRRSRALVLAGGGEIPADQVVTLAELRGPQIGGLPHDEQGFIPVDDYGRVAGFDSVYAAGDVTSFPLRQGGLAAQQADTAAEMIAAKLGAAVTPAPFRPVLRGLLLTGGAPLYLRAEPQRRHRASAAAVEAPARRGPRESSAAAGQPLWWPPAKIAGRYLGPHLATARPQPLSARLLTDRVGGEPATPEDFADALELTLLLADCDARWGDYAAALDALDAAETLGGTLPPAYEARRRKWRAASRAA